MKQAFRSGLSMLLLLLAFSGYAAAAEKATYLVLPFAVEGPQGFSYLEKSVPQMLTSRLYTKGAVEPVSQELPPSQQPAKDESAADKLRNTYKATHVVWGTVTVVGQDCSIDVRVKSQAGKTWHFAGEAPANQFIAAIKVVSDRINKEVFNQTPMTASVAQSAQERGRVNQMNPDIMRNEATPKDVYLNPQFRYSGSSHEDDFRLRSQTLPFVSVGMEVCDANGDGKNDIFILSDHDLHAYRFEAGTLSPISVYSFPRTSECLSVRSWQVGGKTRLVVNTVDTKNQPFASILTFDGKNFKEEAVNLRFFLNVVKVPPTYSPVLVGQKSQKPHTFFGPVCEMIKTSSGYTQGTRLDLPSDVNVFNFTYLPGSYDEKGSDKIITLSPDEHLRVYNLRKARQAETEEVYSGSSKGFELPNEMPGFGEDDVTIKGIFYIPLRMLAIDLERDGKYELLVNRPLSTASKLFNRYRFFPQSEIHSLFWDGLGLNLQWKTRRIKGSVSDFALADANNDGILDLVACINTHPGAVGVKKRKTMIVIYPLDLSSTAVNTPVDKSFRGNE